ncbi:MAG: CxxxxCH/CxxCH domain c-type cytochrome, partial [Planctomycetota bacterium]
LHVNYKSEIVFSNDPKVTGGQYDGTDDVLDAYGSCTNVYCHSNVQTSPPGGPLTYASVTWGGPTLVDVCDACHQGPNNHFSLPLSGNTTGSHTVHSSKGFYCSTCHANDVSEDPTGCIICHTINGPHVTHANGNVDLNIITQYGGNYSGTPQPGDPYGSCTTVYCHSTGQGDTANDPVPYNYSTPSWGNPASGACGTCHPTTTGTALGEISTGSHTIHLNAGARCGDCHLGAGDGTSYSSANHVNQLIDVANSYSAGGVPGNGYGTCSTAYCHSDGQGSFKITPIWGTSPARDCTFCHDAPPGTGAHVKHVQSLPASYGETTVSSLGDVYDFGCGNCHPVSEAIYHREGTVDISLDRDEGGQLKSKHGATEQSGPDDGYTQVQGVSVTCSLAYCHSDGYDNGGYGYQNTPDWYGGSFAGDKCANCHTNSPGTNSHSAHVVGIHYDTVYTGTTDLIQDVDANYNAHGDPTTSITINCNLCHNNTVTTSANDLNTVCATCHDGAPIALQGNAVIDAGSVTHVNGTPDIAFANVTVLSKAQVRDDITTVPELNTNWTRNNNYKAGATSHDSSNSTLSVGAAYGAGSCTGVACHNGNQIEWGAPNVTCNSCHTELP